MTTNTFTVETGRNSTNTVYEKKSGISGLVISPGDITNISLMPDDDSNILAKLKQVVYNLEFTTSNAIPEGGTIEIVYSTNFNLDSAIVPTVVNSGLDENSSMDLLVPNRFDDGYDTASKTLTISNFKDVTTSSTVTM